MTPARGSAVARDAPAPEGGTPLMPGGSSSSSTWRTRPRPSAVRIQRPSSPSKAAGRGVAYHAGRVVGVTYDARAQPDFFVLNTPAGGALQALAALNLGTDNTAVALYGGRAFVSACGTKRVEERSHGVDQPSLLGLHQQAQRSANGQAVRLADLPGRALIEQDDRIGLFERQGDDFRFTSPTEALLEFLTLAPSAGAVETRQPPRRATSSASPR